MAGQRKGFGIIKAKINQLFATCDTKNCYKVYKSADKRRSKGRHAARFGCHTAAAV